MQLAMNFELHTANCLFDCYFLFSPVKTLIPT
jgi:hypothetical protein